MSRRKLGSTKGGAAYIQNLRERYAAGPGPKSTKRIKKATHKKRRWFKEEPIGPVVGDLPPVQIVPEGTGYWELARIQVLRVLPEGTDSSLPFKKLYALYLKSHHWAGVRRRLIHPDSTCTDCSGKKILQIHHKTYSRLGSELDSDLRVLCAGCHRKQHKLK
jgi:hypothetical protein